jgi:hypothetical protein
MSQRVRLAHDVRSVNGRTQSQRGGMAEWSMAVVLKTSRIGYDMTGIVCRVATRSDLQYLAMILAL